MNIQSKLNVLLSFLLLFVAGASYAQAPKAGVSDADYVGGQQCVQCHQAEYDDWKGSHHDLAMQEATAETVLGDFDNARFDYFGVVSEFYRKDDRFFVKTDGPDGALTEYPIAYAFGVYPLQQYLIKFPGGRLQALNIVWDTRSEEEGGQRWYHLYPGEPIKHDDELHWTGLNQNWNFMCADCHSTNLQKNYSSNTDSYDTTWSEIDVSCEACHGPASEHVRWAEAEAKGTAASYDWGEHKGFSLAFDERQGVAWSMNLETGIAKRSEPRTTQKELETCAACHSRRSTAHPNAKPGQPFGNNFHLSLLREPLYHVDGQVDGEVYVYGSFLQSKMYQAGVTCSDCHNPHSLELKADGDQVCAQCHSPAKFAQKSHHMHEPESEGASCVSCHMPEKNFMGVDARNDHSFRVPRPDLSASLGVPNTCTACHDDQDANWAADKLEQHFGKPESDHYAWALAAGQSGIPQGERLLSRLIMDKTQPEIVRATAVTLMPQYLSQESAQLLQMVAQSDEPLMGLALASAAEEIPAQYRQVFTVPLLYDDSRVTRGLAAQSMVGLSMERLPARVKEKYEEGLDVFVHSNQFNADRPESLTNLANFYQQQGMRDAAERYYRRAIEMSPYFTPAFINLSELSRQQGDESAVRKVLQEGLASAPQPAVIHHAMGLSYVREKNMPEALRYLRMAAEAEGSSARYLYVYAVALNSNGQAPQAIEVLEKGLERYPADTSLLSTLVSIYERQGNAKMAEYYRQKLTGRN